MGKSEEKRKRKTKTTRSLCKEPYRLRKTIFIAVVLVTCILICVTIHITGDYYYVVHTTTVPCQYSEGIQTQPENVDDICEKIRTITENIRTPPIAESKLLYNKVRVLCWVMTMPSNHMTKARHVKATWGRRCNKLLFMSSATDPLLGTVKLNVSEGRKHLWDKTQNAFEYVYEHHLNDADWFMKADDDTFVIVENLRHFLRNHSGEDSVYFGYRFDGGFVSGGAGYVLSRRAVRLFVERGLRSGACPNVSKAEDVQISACLKVVGVRAGDSRDSQGHDRFFPFNPIEAILNSVYYEDEQEFNISKEMRASETAISFHYVPTRMMYVMEYIIYHLKLEGGVYPEEMAIAYQL